MTRLYAGSALALAAAMLGIMGYMVWRGEPVSFLASGDDPFAGCRATQVSGGSGMIGGPFTLVNGTGETVTDDDVITEPSILYFGYTFCPDVCPFDAARNAAAVDILQDRGISTTPVFISIDPERDTPDAVAEFADAMHPKMIGLTGNAEQVRAASQAYRTYFNRRETEDPDFYLMDHSVFSYLVLPEHGFVEFYRRELSPEEMASSVACFVDAAS